MEIEITIRTFFEEKNNVLSVDLFGSYAQHKEHAWSDIDIAILCDPFNLPSPLEIIVWREDLIAVLHKEVDLVCLNEASPILGMQVAKSCKHLFIKNPHQYALYQMRLFAEYAELKELRAPMEKNILNRKLL